MQRGRYLRLHWQLKAKLDFFLCLLRERLVSVNQLDMAGHLGSRYFRSDHTGVYMVYKHSSLAGQVPMPNYC